MAAIVADGKDVHLTSGDRRTGNSHGSIGSESRAARPQEH
jgi:hypothetical protein